jgi:DNA-binding FadR family transcriptional regulator
MNEFIRGARGMILSNSENWERLMKQHEDIYDALAAHNQTAAVSAMRKHFELIDEYMI